MNLYSYFRKNNTLCGGGVGVLLSTYFAITKLTN